MFDNHIWGIVAKYVCASADRWSIIWTLSVIAIFFSFRRPVFLES